MGTVKNAIYKVDNGVDFDEIYFKTKAAQVFCNDGKTVESQLAEIVNGFANIKSENGYTKLLNGIIFQWGAYYGSVNNIAFPIAFPTSCLEIIPCPEIKYDSSPVYLPKVGIVSKNHAGFTSACYGYDELGVPDVAPSSMKWIRTVGYANLNAKIKYYAIGY